VNSAHKNSAYLCKKTCSRAEVAETSEDVYKPICMSSDQPLSNIYSYCDSKMNDKDSIKMCKLDMCNLCCSTLDSMQHKNFSLETIKKCFKDCSAKFNN
jgi:hypothetical protein